MPGRPRKAKRKDDLIRYRVTEDQYRRAEVAADRKGLEVGAYARMALLERLDRDEAEQARKA